MRLISVFLVLFFLLFWNISHGEYAPDLGDNMMIQLQWEINTSYNVDVYSIDLFDTSTEFISKLQEKNIWVICYFSAGTFENWREDAELFPIEVLWKDLSNWPGEKWLDVSKYDLFKDIMLARFRYWKWLWKLKYGISLYIYKLKKKMFYKTSFFLIIWNINEYIFNK